MFKTFELGHLVFEFVSDFDIRISNLITEVITKTTMIAIYYLNK